MGISSAGVGSGLDVTNIISQLMAIEKRPLTQLTSKATVLNAQLSSFGTLKGKVSALQDAAAALAKPDFWTKTSARATDAGISVTSGASATPGQYMIGVSQLATAQSLASATVAGGSGAIIGTGKLRIELGSWANLGTATAAFTAKSGATAVDIEIGSGDNTLAGIRNKINAANAGVSASIVNDSSGSRLVIRSKATGVENALRIQQVDDGGLPVTGGALASLTYNTAGGAATPMTQTAAAKDALATIDGLPLVSSSNTFSNVAEGMSFTASVVTTADVTASVGIDTGAFTTALAKFTAAYNDLNTTIRGLTKYDDASKTGAILQGDSTALTIQNQLRNLVQGKGGTSSVFSRLGDLGIALQRDGSLTTDNTKLTNALNKPAEVALMMSSASDVTGANRGVAALFQSFASTITSTEGTLSTRSESLSNRIKANTKEQDRFNERLEATQTRLQKYYSALDTKMATLSGLSTYMTQQVTRWNSTGN